MAPKHEHQHAVEVETVETVETVAVDPFATLAATYARPISGLMVPARAPYDPDWVVANPALAAAICNFAFFGKAEVAIKSAFAKDGKQAGLSDADKLAYASAVMNSGGTVAGYKVDGYKHEPDLAMSLLDEATDRVRWDFLCAATDPNGQTYASGEYKDHKSAADIDERSIARAKMLLALDSPCATLGGQTYGELILAKANEVLGIRPPVRTRKAKVDSKAVPI